MASIVSILKRLFEMILKEVENEVIKNTLSIADEVELADLTDAIRSKDLKKTP